MPIVATYKLGGATVHINDECLLPPEEQAAARKKISAIALDEFKRRYAADPSWRPEWLKAMPRVEYEQKIKEAPTDEPKNSTPVLER